MKKEDLINGYFSNSLTPNEEQLFEILLAENPDFRTQFEFEKDLKRVINEKESKRLKSKLETFEAEIKTEEKPIKSTVWFNWKMAAAVLLFMSAGWFGYDAFFGVNTIELYTSNYDIYPNTAYPITRSDTVNTIEREAFVAYESQDYDLAITNFNTIENPKNYISFYKAQTYLQLGNLEEAKELFQKNTNEPSRYIGESHWYLALIYLKQNDKILAKKELKTLLQKHKYKYKREEAKKILNILS